MDRPGDILGLDRAEVLEIKGQLVTHLVDRFAIRDASKGGEIDVTDEG